MAKNICAENTNVIIKCIIVNEQSKYKLIADQTSLDSPGKKAKNGKM